MDFGEVLTKAWRIIWKHKILWIFGILAGCGRGGGGGGGGSGWRQSQPFGQNAGPAMQHWGTQISNWIVDHLWIVVLIGLGLLLLILISIFLGTIGRIGLIRGTLKADGGADRLIFSELFQESLKYFWRVFGLAVLVWLATVILVLIFILPVVAVTAITFGLALLCLLPVLCILVPVSIAIGVVIQQAVAAIVIDDVGVMEGVRRGWEVVKKNIGPMALIWLIVAVIGFAFGILLALPILFTVVPAAIAYGVSGQLPGATAWIVGGVCLAVYIPFYVILYGILTAYIESVWALTYLRLTRPKEGNQAPAALPVNA